MFEPAAENKLASFSPPAASTRPAEVHQSSGMFYNKLWRRLFYVICHWVPINHQKTNSKMLHFYIQSVQTALTVKQTLSRSSSAGRSTPVTDQGVSSACWSASPVGWRIVSAGDRSSHCQTLTISVSVLRLFTIRKKRHHLLNSAQKWCVSILVNYSCFLFQKNSLCLYVKKMNTCWLISYFYSCFSLLL